jgi:uncharacterized RDD family membrane protein YckC
MISPAKLDHVDPSTFRYAGFGPRFSAAFLDGLIFWPLAFLFDWLETQSTLSAVACMILNSFLWIGYDVYCHARWGQTIGKMWQKIRVVALDGKRIYFRQAFIRNIVEIILQSISIPFMIIAILKIPEATLRESGYGGLNHLLFQENYLPSNYLTFFLWAAFTWSWSEVIVLLTNRQRRAIHDFIAGTVVVHTEPPKKGKDWVPESGGNPSRCPKCNKEYPSNYWFTESGICKECDEKTDSDLRRK